MIIKFEINLFITIFISIFSHIKIFKKKLRNNYLKLSKQNNNAI